MTVTFIITYSDATTLPGTGACTVFANGTWELFHPTATGKKVVSVVVVAPANEAFDLTILPKVAGTSVTLTQANADGDNTATTYGAIDWSPNGAGNGQKILLESSLVAAQDTVWRFAGAGINIGSVPTFSIGQT